MSGVWDERLVDRHPSEQAGEEAREVKCCREPATRIRDTDKTAADEKTQRGSYDMLS